jgi:hypothetical protein
LFITRHPTTMRGGFSGAATGVVVFVVATVVSLTWLALVPVPDPAGPYAIVFPFPFASGEFRASP